MIYIIEVGLCKPVKIAPRDHFFFNHDRCTLCFSSYGDLVAYVYDNTSFGSVILCNELFVMCKGRFLYFLVDLVLYKHLNITNVISST